MPGPVVQVSGLGKEIDTGMGLNCCMCLGMDSGMDMMLSQDSTDRVMTTSLKLGDRAKKFFSKSGGREIASFLKPGGRTTTLSSKSGSGLRTSSLKSGARITLGYQSQEAD